MKDSLHLLGTLADAEMPSLPIAFHPDEERFEGQYSSSMMVMMDVAVSHCVVDVAVSHCVLLLPLKLYSMCFNGLYLINVTVYVNLFM